MCPSYENPFNILILATKSLLILPPFERNTFFIGRRGGWGGGETSLIEINWTFLKKKITHTRTHPPVLIVMPSLGFSFSFLSESQLSTLLPRELTKIISPRLV